MGYGILHRQLRTQFRTEFFTLDLTASLPLTPAIIDFISSSSLLAVPL
jgi:hypothetical protein